MGGSNDVGSFPGDLPLFVADKVQYLGQVIGLVVADSANTARRGVRK